MAILRGVDGCSAGWLCASASLESGNLSAVSARTFPDAATLLRSTEVAVTAIDIPIGLPSASPRSCDGEARRLPGPRASSVFPAPVRSTLSARSYQEACVASLRACGKKLSKQTYAILPRIRDVDTVLRESPELLASVWEVHPELCFCFWNNQKPMRHPKQSGFGFVERYRLIEGVFGGAAERIRDSLPRAAVSDDDILDALAALWTALRIHSGKTSRLPSKDERDDHGLPMQMLA